MLNWELTKLCSTVKEVFVMSYGEKMIQSLKDGSLEEANLLFAQALEHDSDEELYLLSDSLYELGFIEETKAINLQLLEVYPENDELKVGLAEIAIEEGDMESAMDWLAKIEETSEAYPQALLVSADLYYVQGLYEVSEQKLLQAKEVVGDEPAVIFALAELHFSMGKYAQAIKGYEDLMVQGYDELSGINLSARCGGAYSAMGDFEEAINYLKQSLEESEHVDTLFQLGFTYMQQKEYQRANESFFKLKELDPSYTSVYPFLAKGLEEELRLDKAQEVIQEGLQYDEFNPELYVQGANIYLKLEDEEAAEGYYQKALELDPDNAAYLLAYTNLLNKQERFSETVEIIQHALTEDEVDPQFYWNMAIANEGLEEYEAAGNSFAKAYPSFKQNASFLKNYISYLREEGDRVFIKEVLRDYLLIEPSDEEMLSFYESINSNY